ncbi:uncharacterized protein LOC128305957 [Anopheles moucheti]|uniref:uncharacterized protein LOC128305957 n=1 Tax=Anopheles moucheti TaxID=186751 RepID=UPI0022F100E8|nr:uncharacterized protein LOC128305957 [Anopheles moucheti]
MTCRCWNVCSPRPPNTNMKESVGRVVQIPQPQSQPNHKHRSVSSLSRWMKLYTLQPTHWDGWKLSGRRMECASCVRSNPGHTTPDNVEQFSGVKDSCRSLPEEVPPWQMLPFPLPWRWSIPGDPAGKFEVDPAALPIGSRRTRPFIFILLLMLHMLPSVSLVVYKKTTKFLEMPGIDPGTSHMLSERSTI